HGEHTSGCRCLKEFASVHPVTHRARTILAPHTNILRRFSLHDEMVVFIRARVMPTKPAQFLVAVVANGRLITRRIEKPEKRGPPRLLSSASRSGVDPIANTTTAAAVG